ncbi:NUDIX domain-containing protein [Methylorubrum sp. GM97]|uniref:NUDIX domain-containing protein n=1 Tax=Methylorubrum sp. GM97 TaxID=2938232 RepID=UPI0021C31CC0|nr:NUDIX domain-containing protein [Methylorubrum sp. GM97]
MYPIDTATYATIITLMPIACVDVAIVAGGKVLLVRRLDEPAKGQWWLPGGRVLKGEMMRDTAIRKARDEVGIICNVGPIIHTAETIFDAGPAGIPVHSINSCFFLYPKGEDISISLDVHHEDYCWISSIDRAYHQYVQQCLLAAGLNFEGS